MVGIGRVGAAYGGGAGGRVARHAGFRVGGEARAEGVAAAAGVAMPSLLAAQEAGEDAVRDREARRHGEKAVAALGALQLALLRGEDGGAALSGLAAAPAAADPRLAAVQRALLVRVAVEAARTRSGG